MIEGREEICRRDPSFKLLYGNPRAPMADAGDLGAYLEGDGVDLAVACGFGFADQGALRACNNYILEAARQDRRIIPFTAVSGGSRRADLREGERCLKLGARGIGEVGFYLGGLRAKEGKALDNLARLAGEAGSILMLHVNEQVGHQYPGKTPVDLAELAKVVSAHQDATIVLAHLGGGLCFYEFMPEIKRDFGNVYYDTAALPFLYGPPIYAFLARFLREKTLFGSDFPLLSLERYGDGLAALSSGARGQIMGANARRLLGG
jgi:uncharacterized protein